MYGAIIGDITGSYYEVLEVAAKKSKTDTSEKRYQRRMKIMDLNFPLFDENSSYTDDTVTTLAILDATLNNKNYETTLIDYCSKEINLGVDKYGRSRFGANFCHWILHREPRDSYGNGCAMRVSAIGFLCNDIETVKKKTKEATIVSHNHPESLLCAEAVTTSIFYLRNKMSKEQLKEYINKNYFKVDYDINDLRHNYTFTSKAIDSVPIAIYSFLISNSFEDAIRIAISCGGDTDTIAAITGSLAESYYGIDHHLIDDCNKYLHDEQISLLNKVYHKKTYVLE